MARGGLEHSSVCERADRSLPGHGKGQGIAAGGPVEAPAPYVLQAG